MKHAFIKSLIILSMAFGFSISTTSALAYHTTCCKSCYKPYKTCFNKNYYTCKWVPAHRHHGVWYEGHYHCWSTYGYYKKVKGHYYTYYKGCGSLSQKVCNYNY